MTARSLAQLATYLIDFVTISTLFATSEIHPYFLICIPIIIIIKLLNQIQLFKIFTQISENQRKNRIFFVVISVFTIITAVTLWLKFKFSLIVAAASCVPFLHSSLWLMSEKSNVGRSLQLRLALGFTELIIASILTSGVYLTFSIFAFTLLGAVAISCSFLDKAFEENNEPTAYLNRRYITSILAVAFLVLMSAIVIFPILPRAQTHHGQEYGSRKVGYTEHVNLDQLSPLFGNKGGQVLIRIEGTAEIESLIPFGLLRAKTLDQFDGTRWEVGEYHRPSAHPKPYSMTQETFKWLNFKREPIESYVLPVPYGTELVLMLQNSFTAKQTLTGTWINRDSIGTSVNYRVGLKRNSPTVKYGSGKDDLPTSDQLSIPAVINTTALKNLNKKIFSSFSFGKSNPEALASKIREFYKKERYSASTDTPLAVAKLNPLLNFLFVSKSGNCELFATAAAILLRLHNIPTRLVTGFRLSRASQGGIQLIRTGDAHAWIEFWIEGKGWRVFDPTPRTAFELSIWDKIQDVYDNLESVWYRYAYSYDVNAQMQISQKGINNFKDTQSLIFSKNGWAKLIQNLTEASQKWLLAGTSAIVFVFFYFAFNLGNLIEFVLILFTRKTDVPLWLRLSKKQMEILIRNKIGLTFSQGTQLFRLKSVIEKEFGIKASQAYLNWQEHYLEARFSQPSIDQLKTRRLLKSQFKELKTLIQSIPSKVT